MFERLVLLISLLILVGVACQAASKDATDVVEQAAEDSIASAEVDPAEDIIPSPTVEATEPAELTAVPTSTAEPTATPTNTPEPTLAAALSKPLPVLGKAPAIENDVWLNTDDALSLAELEGKVVLVEFWTFGCINCKRVIPHIREWYSAYAGDDFEIVAVHYPEFTYEEDVDNVRAAIEQFEIEYPVAIDNDGQTWRRWRQRYWPTRYLIDRDGNIRYKHIGEGAYEQTATFIEALIAEEN